MPASVWVNTFQTRGGMEAAVRLRNDTGFNQRAPTRGRPRPLRPRPTPATIEPLPHFPAADGAGDP